MAKSTFSYVTYIRTTPDKLWNALTTAEILKRCWMSASIESDWKAGSRWRAVSEDGTVYDSGEIVECIPEKRLVMRWRNQWNPEFMSEGDSLCTYEIERVGTSVKFTITHTIERSDSKFIASVTAAWPMVASNLKSLLETGEIALVDNPRHGH